MTMNVLNYIYYLNAWIRGLYFKLIVGSKGKVLVYGSLPIIRGNPKKIKINGTVKIYEQVTFVVSDINKDEFIEISDGVVVERNSYLNAHGGKIQIRSNVHIGVGNILQGKAGIEIHDDTMLGPNVQIYSTNHMYEVGSSPRKMYPEHGKKIKIGSNVWVCANAVILSGAEISDDQVILPLAVIRT